MIHRSMRLREIEKHAVEMEVRLEYAVARRRNFLLWELSRWLNAETDLLSWNVVCAPRIWAIFDDIALLNRDVAWRDKPKREGDITDEMKQRARQFPIERLIEFDVRGNAPCFIHGEKTGSLHLYKHRNRAHCFGCGVEVNSLDVLMLREGKSFSDAVRYLCRG